MSEESYIDWSKANFRNMFRPQPHIEPAVDEVVSQIVGQKIYQQDPRLIKLIVKWKQNKSPDSMEADNFLNDSHKIEELKQVLNKPL